MSAQPKSLLTAEQFFDLGDIGPAELIDGKVIYLSPTGPQHGGIAARLTVLLDAHISPKRLGLLMTGETGFRLAPRRVRAPDIAFVGRQRLGERAPQQFLDGPPDLAVEIVSPSDHYRDVQAKVRDWLKHGARSVWVVDPDTRTIAVSRADGTAAVFGERDTLRDPAVFPKLRLKVKDVFARPW